MDLHAFWNIIATIVAAVAAGVNFAYYFTHINGKKYIRLWIGSILTISVFFRVLLAVGVLNDTTFDDWFRPFTPLIYMAFMLGPYIDWNMPEKKMGTKA